MAKSETNYEQMGIAAMIPGMQHMIDLMQSELDDMRMRLGISQTAPKKRGRPRKELTDSEAHTLDAMLRQREQPLSKFDSWSTLTPEEREKRSQKLSDAQRRIRGLPPKVRTNANGQALLATGWPADPEERRKEMQRRRSKWTKAAKARQAQGAAAHWGKQSESEQRGVSPQKLAWLKLTPEQKAARVKHAKRALKKAHRSLAAASGGWANLTPEQRAARAEKAAAARAASMAAKAAEDR